MFVLNSLSPEELRSLIHTKTFLILSKRNEGKVLKNTPILFFGHLNLLLITLNTILCILWQPLSSSFGTSDTFKFQRGWLIWRNITAILFLIWRKKGGWMVGWMTTNLLLLILSYKVLTSLGGLLRMFRTTKDKTNIKSKLLMFKRSTTLENECNRSLINCMNSNKDFLRNSDSYLFFMYKRSFLSDKLTFFFQLLEKYKLWLWTLDGLSLRKFFCLLSNCSLSEKGPLWPVCVRRLRISFFKLLTNLFCSLANYN